MRLMIATAMAVALLAAAPVMAKPLDGGVTARDVADILKAEGYKADISTDKGGDPMITSGAEGRRFVIAFYGCEKERCTSYQMVAGFATDDKPSLDKMNTWNRKHRFGRAYIDDDRDPILEMDIDAEKGFTTEAISNNLATWVVVLSAFVKEFDL